MNDTPPVVNTRFADLPDETKLFLKRLDEDDIKLLWAAIKFMAAALTVARFFKWLLWAAIGAFVTMATVGDALTKLKPWWLLAK